MSQYRDPNLVRALAEQGYSDREIAERAGVSPDAVRQLVNGSRTRSREQSRASPACVPPAQVDEEG